VHEEERILGGNFEVNADLIYDEPSVIINKLNQTIDYSIVFGIIKQRMEKPTPLLETITMELADELKQAFPVTNEINLRIKKINAPIASFSGNVEVCYTKKYI
jgi:dihydroneopterin aldolase